MARIAGVDLPRDKRVEVGLTYIFGIGPTVSKQILEVTGSRIVPAWLECDREALKGTVKSLPTREEIDVPVDELQIVELYSK